MAPGTFGSSMSRARFLADVVEVVLVGYGDNAADALRAYDLARKAAGLGPLPADFARVATADPGAILAAVDETVTRRLASEATSSLTTAQAVLAAASARAATLAAYGATDTVTTAVRRDPRAVGWERFDDVGTTCHRCLVLIARGPVYDVLSGSFARHPGCTCGARAVFRDRGPSPEAREAYGLYLAVDRQEFVYPDGHRFGGQPLSLRSVLAAERAGTLDAYRPPTA
ncbi:hypothetical protein [Isoptericola luteus]|nr:hypothetical protein [Isoptericola sp. NEAU-Y5]